MKKLRPLWLSILFLSVILLLQTGRQSSILASNLPDRANFSCSSVSEIPRRECEALVALFNSTAGTEWTNNDGWLQTNTPCGWYGINCQMAWGKVNHLWLPDNNLKGKIPPELGNLVLRWLYLPDNKLTGSIPESVASAGSTQVVLRNNELTGAIPAQFGTHTGLLALDVSHNKLDGQIPDTLGRLTNLDVLDVSSNSLYGPLSGELVNLRNLSIFNFNNTGLCEPENAAFQAWLSGIWRLNRTGTICGTKPWTLMYYFASDNNLTDYLGFELSSLSKAGGNSSANIVYFYDRQRDLGSYYGGFSPHFLPFRRDEVSTGDPQVLTDYIQWAQDNFPAENYALILIDHSYGVTGFGTDDHAIGDSSERCPSRPCLTFSELREALIPIPKLDIVYIAACSSATIEVGYELRNQAEYLVASEQIAWANRDHSLYITGTTGISNDTTAEILAVRMANSYAIERSGPLTISVVHLPDVQNVVEKTDLLGSLLAEDMGNLSGNLEDVRADVQHFSTADDLDMNEDDEFDLVDLWDVALMVKQSINNAEIREAADELIADLDDYIVWNYRRKGEFSGVGWESQCPDGTCNWELEKSHGVSVYWPAVCPSFYSAEWLDFAAGADCDANFSMGASTISGSNGWATMLVDYTHAINPDAPNNPNPPPLAEMLSTMTFSYLPHTSGR